MAVKGSFKLLCFWEDAALKSFYKLFDFVRPFDKMYKKGKRKVQGVPQSQTAVLPRPQEEEETDKSKQAQTKPTYEKH